MLHSPPLLPWYISFFFRPVHIFSTLPPSIILCNSFTLPSVVSVKTRKIIPPPTSSTIDTLLLHRHSAIMIDPVQVLKAAPSVLPIVSSHGSHVYLAIPMLTHIPPAHYRKARGRKCRQEYPLGRLCHHVPLYSCIHRYGDACSSCEYLAFP